MTTHSTTKADLTLFGITFLAASGWIFSKLAVEGMPPLGYIGLRYLLSVLFILPFAIKPLLSMTRAQFKIGMIVGLMQTGAMYFWISAIAASDQLGEGAFIMTLSMILVPFIGRLMYGRQIESATLKALPVAIIGVALLALKDGWQFEPAQTMYLTACLFMATHFVYTSQNASGMSSTAMSVMLLLVPGIAGMAMSLTMETWPQEVSNETWGWVLAAVIIATALRYFLYTWALKTAEPNFAALIMILEPVWTAIASTIWFDEVMTLQKLAGCGLILIAILIARWSSLAKLLGLTRKTEAVAVETQ